MSGAKSPGAQPVPEIIDDADDDALMPQPGGLTFTLLSAVTVMVTGPGVDEEFVLEDRDLLTVAREAWRRRHGVRDGRHSRIGATMSDMAVAIDSYARTHPRDSSLRPGTLAGKIAAHAAKLGLGELDAYGPLRDVCGRLIVFWRQQGQQARYGSG